jgi:hypothetical protein
MPPPIVWFLAAGAIFPPAGFIGYLIGCHRYPSSSPKFRVEESVVRDARKKFIEQQAAREKEEIERLNVAFGYPKDFR